MAHIGNKLIPYFFFSKSIMDQEVGFSYAFQGLILTGVLALDHRTRKQRGGRLQLRGSLLVTPRPTWPALSRHPATPIS